MSTKRFLIPMGAAVAALLPVQTKATPVIQQPSNTVSSPSSNASGATGQGPVKELSYPSGSELHLLLLRQAESKLFFAGHGSHHSHYSHQSHRSGY